MKISSDSLKLFSKDILILVLKRNVNIDSIEKFKSEKGDFEHKWWSSHLVTPMLVPIRSMLANGKIFRMKEIR